MRRRLEPHIKDAKSDDLLNPCACIEHRREERVITTAISGGPINCGQHRLNLIEFEVLDRTGTRSFEGHHQDPLTEVQLIRMLRSTVAKERVNRGEAHVSGRRDTVPVHFEVLEEIQYFLRTQICKIQIAYRPPSLCRNELQQQNKRITVTLDGVRAGSTYSWKMIREETTQRTAKCIGGCAVQCPPPALTDVVMRPPQ